MRKLKKQIIETLKEVSNGLASTNRSLKILSDHPDSPEAKKSHEKVEIFMGQNEEIIRYTSKNEHSISRILTVIFTMSVC